MSTRPFTGVKRGATWTWDGGEKDRMSRLIEKLKDGRWEWICRRPKNKRSVDQNAYLHAEVFPKVAAYMGEDIEGAKLAMMGECWGWKWSELLRREVPVKPRTSSMTVEECTYFIEWAPAWAQEHCDDLRILLPIEWTPDTEDSHSEDAEQETA